jgi:DNA-binding NarL/FixJ family response regulator
MDTRTTLLVVDDQAIVRDGLVTVLSLQPDLEIVGEASNGEEAVQKASALAPDVVLMDLRMPVLDGAEATALIIAEHPETAILVLTTFSDDTSIADALRAGARGYITKDAERSELVAAIRAVASGQRVFDAEVGARLVEALVAGGSKEAQPAGAGARARSLELQTRFDLSRREADVLAEIANGLTNAEIAATLFISVATVKSHINTILAKLGARDRAQAIILARS